MNFLGHLSGIATLTRRYVEAVAGTRARIVDTRKTTPGLRAFEKLAVRAGGGHNHRFGLYDAILIKDNHIVAAGGVKPAGSRLALFERFARYSNPQAQRATERYVALARERGLDAAQLALAYVTSRPFTTSTIIGATSMDQLKTDIGAAGLTLADAVLEDIEQIHLDYPNPCP